MIHVSLLASHHWHPYWFAFSISSLSNVGPQLCQWRVISHRVFGWPFLCNFVKSVTKKSFLFVDI